MKNNRRWALLVLFLSFSLGLGANSVPLLAEDLGTTVSSGPVLSISPTSATYATQTVGTSSSPKVFTVSNTGDSDLVISAISFTGTNPADFSFAVVPPQQRPKRQTRGAVVATATFPLKVPSGKSTSVIVAFTPTASGSRSAGLTLTHNAPNSPQTVALSGGTNSAGILIAPTTLNFSSQFVGTTSNPTPITVTNNGAGNLVLTGLGLTGANPSDFVYTLDVTQTDRRPHRNLNVVIPPSGNVTINVAFKPTASGSRAAALNITDNASGSPQVVAMSGSATVPLGVFSIGDVSLGSNLEKLISVTVDNAPGSELPVTITSSDASKVVLSTDTTGTTTGTVSINSSIHSGSNSIFPGFYVQAVGSSGTAQLTVSSPGYASATSTATIGPAGFVLIGPDGTSNDFSTTAGAPDTALSIALRNLDASGNPVTSNPPARLRGGLTVSVPVLSGAQATGTILNSPSVFNGGSSNGSSVSFHPLAAGTSLLSLGTPNTSGFTAPASGAHLTATVTPQEILLNPVTVGSNLEIAGGGRLSTPAPQGDLLVTITSADPSKVLLSTDMTGQSLGSESIMVTVPAGQGAPAGFPGFMVQGLASSGTVQLIATAPGFQSGTANVALTPSGFVIDGGKGNGQDFSTTPISADTPLKLTATRLDPQGNPAAPGTVRGGIFVFVPLSSGTPATGTVTSDSAVLVGGDSTNSEVSFHPIANGTSVLSVGLADGFSVPTSGSQLTATVTSPAIALNVPNSKVGNNLQVQGFGSLNAPAPAQGLQVTISSNNANVLVSNSPTTQGSSSINLTIPAGQGMNGVGFPIFYIQALSATGGATITASSPGGFSSTTANVTLTPGGFVLTSPNGLGADFATLHGSGTTTNLTVSSYQLNSVTSAPETAEAVRGGLNIGVTVSLGTPTVGSISGSPAQYTGGVTNVQIGFLPGADVGTSTITAAPPAGFIAPSSAGTIHVNVN